jgi:hypothetical protein
VIDGTAAPPDAIGRGTVEIANQRRSCKPFGMRGWNVLAAGRCRVGTHEAAMTQNREVRRRVRST